MDRIWDSTDKILCGIGRFVLLRPGISGLLLLLILLGMLWNNGVFYTLDNEDRFVLAASTSPDVLIDESNEIAQPPADSPATQTLAEAQSQPTAAQPVPLNASEPTKNVLQPLNWRTVKVASGDTLSRIFQRNKISVKDAVAISKLKSAKPLTNLVVGNNIGLLTNADNSLNVLVYAINDQKTLTIKSEGKGFKIEQLNKPVSLVMQETEIQTTPLSSGKTTNPVSTNTALSSETSSNTSPQTPVASAQIATATKETTAKDNPPAAKTKSEDKGIIYASGEISHSLYTDARKAGLSVKQANQLAQIFPVKSVVKNLKKGDAFSVLYEKSTKGKNGETKSGNILLAQLTHKGETYQAIRFTDPNGKATYYDEHGRSALPALSRAPLAYTKISSHFSKGRMHPLLRIVRPHTGIDYSAPSGTPIKAAGDGVIVYSAYKSGYGNMVTIEHDDKYSTLYAHLSRFAKDAKKGSTVKAGQIIGYVGQTGTATGAHLHYEILVNNVPKDPLTVSIPGASVPKAYKKQFLAQVKTLLAELKTNKSIKLAKNEERKPPASRG